IKHEGEGEHRPEDAAATAITRSWGSRFNAAFNLRFNLRFHRALDWYQAKVETSLLRPWLVVGGILSMFLGSLLILPLLGVAFFPRTDAGQFVISLKAPSGTRIEGTNRLVSRLEDLVRQVVRREDLERIVSNIGVIPGFSSIYTSNSGPHTA